MKHNDMQARMLGEMLRSGVAVPFYGVGQVGVCLCAHSMFDMIAHNKQAATRGHRGFPIHSPAQVEVLCE